LGQFKFDGSQGPWSTFCGNNPNAGACNNGYADALADFLAGDVSSSSIGVGDAERKVLVNGYDFFVQDNWQITSKLNINYGLRYEYFGPPQANEAKDLGVFVEGQGLKVQGAGVNSIFQPDHNNFAPRVGFAYNPLPGVVIRGGGGVYYDQINMNPFFDFRPPIGAADGLEDNPIGIHPVDSYSRSGYNWTAAQAGGAAIFPGVTTCLGNFATDPNCLSASQIFNVYSVNQHFRTPYFYNYNLNVEKSFGNSSVVQLGYVGSQGRKLSVMQDINQNGAFNAQYPNYGSILQLNSQGTSNYNSLQAIYKIRMWKGVTGQFAYTWAHSLDEVTEYRGTIPHDTFNLQEDYASSDFDTRHNFTAFLTWAIPGSSHLKLLTTGWEASTLISLHTGEPFNMLTGTDASGTQRPGLNINANPFAGVNRTFSAANGGEYWINPAAFCVPGSAGCPGTASPDGDVGRNAFTGPGFADVDLSVFKTFTLKERFRLQLRAEMFNVFNRINLASGAFSVGSNGYVGDTIGDFNGSPGLGPGEPFNLQLAAKITF